MYQLPDSPKSGQSFNDSNASNDSQDLSGLDSSTVVEHTHTHVSSKRESYVWHPHEDLICCNPNKTGKLSEEDHTYQQNCSNVHNGIILTDISKHKGRYMYPDEMFLQSLQQLGPQVPSQFLLYFCGKSQRLDRLSTRCHQSLISKDLEVQA